MRVGFSAAFRFGDADHLKQFHSAGAPGLFVHALMNAQHFGNLVANAEDGVEGSLRLLENHRNAVAANLNHLIFAGSDQVFAVKNDFARDDFAGGAHQAHN